MIYIYIYTYMHIYTHMLGLKNYPPGASAEETPTARPSAAPRVTAYYIYIYIYIYHYYYGYKHMITL